MKMTFNLAIRTFIVALLLGFWVNQLAASDLKRVSLVAKDVLLLEFDDGHIEYYGEGEEWWKGFDNITYHSPLDLSEAETLANYTITSPDHSGWGTVTPSLIGRKSKGAEFNEANADIEYTLEHKIYLKLPQEMVDGNTYTITVNDLADNLNEFTFTLDSTRMRSESIHVNQIGFAELGRKIAYVSQWMGDLGHLELNDMAGQSFNIVRYSDGVVVHTGTIGFRAEHDNELHIIHNGKLVNMPSVLKNHTHADVVECDFT
ncbi:MAG: hypothetical protein AAF558_11520, partial [Verrucomicrobiota bacterium]